MRKRTFIDTLPPILEHSGKLSGSVCDRAVWSSNSGSGGPNVGRFANGSFRQRSFRKRLRSVRKYLWSVRKRVEVSSQTLSTFICVEASSVLISDVNIWPYKLTLKPSLVVDFTLSQRLRIACTIAVIRKSIYRYETGLTVVVFYQEAFLLRSTNSERPDKNASILEWNIDMVAKWRTLNVSMSFTLYFRFR